MSYNNKYANEMNFKFEMLILDTLFNPKHKFIVVQYKCWLWTETILKAYIYVKCEKWYCSKSIRRRAPAGTSDWMNLLKSLIQINFCFVLFYYENSNSEIRSKLSEKDLYFDRSHLDLLFTILRFHSKMAQFFD